jgi:3-hydroxyisobutyrate dehydrogenase-like beta-hydroxyacid dehydrogenase
MIMAAMQAMAEGISLAKKSGIDETMWMNMITSTLFNCGSLYQLRKFYPERGHTSLLLSAWNLD